MSTSAMIRFCDGNNEVGAIALHADGYPEFMRDRLLSRLADEGYADADEAMDTLPYVLAELYNWDIFADDEQDLRKMERAYRTYSSYRQGREQFGSVCYEYTVHVVDGRVYY